MTDADWQSTRNFIYNKRVMSLARQKLFFAGIGGSGVSAIARFMAERGHRVCGSDRAFLASVEHPVCAALRASGIRIVPPDGSGVTPDIDLFIYSTAVEPGQPDRARASELGLQILSRPDYLARISSDFRTIAVAGTSGKSTTAGMLAFAMQQLGMSPSFIGGGRVKQFRTPDNPGNALIGTSDYLIIEACESDGSIINYQPLHTILLNLERDHHEVVKTAGLFRCLLNQTRWGIYLNADDANLSAPDDRNAVGFSLSGESAYRAENIALGAMESAFTVHGFPFRLTLPGLYNVYNALACIACLGEIGVPMHAVSGVLAHFQGIDRRFDIRRNDGQALVIDDYAHNPHKIHSMMQAMQSVSPAIFYIFQPHGFGPTRMMKDEYIAAFAQNLRREDSLAILPIYYAGGTAQKDISSEDLAEGIRRKGKSARALDTRADLFPLTEAWNTYVVLGARDESLSTLADDIAARIGENHPT